MSLCDSGWPFSMSLDLDCGLFLVFRTSWLLWSQPRLSKLVKAVFCHITEVFLCERAPSFTVVRPCYKRPTKAWLVCHTGVNSQSDCGSGTITSEVFDIGLAFIAGSLPVATSTVSAQRPWPRQWDWGLKVACISLYSTSTLQESGTVPQNQCIGFN